MAQIKGTGVDIIEIHRIENAVCASERFSQRVFTSGERELYLAPRPKWGSLAARFAAKEAIVKALGTGIGSVKWTDIEVTNDAVGKPRVVLSGAAEEKARELGIDHWELSISHCRDYAVAFVVAY